MKFKSDHNLLDRKKKDPGAFSKPGYKYSEDFENPEIYKKFGEYILGEYVSDNCAISRNGILPGATETITVLREYALAKQPRTKYQEILDSSEDKAVDKGLMNISWRNHQFMPIFRQLAISKISKANIGFEVNAIDSLSKDVKISQINKMKIMTNPAMHQMMQATGVVPENMPDMKGISSPDDVDDLVKLGKIILPVEAEMKDGIDESLVLSKYSDGIKPDLIKDIIECGGGAVYVTTQEGSGVIKSDYVDLDSLIIRYSKRKDFNNVDYVGFIRKTTIRELREQGMSEKDLMLVAKKYERESSNLDLLGAYGSELLKNSGEQRRGYINTYGKFPEDGFLVDEFVFYFVAGVTEKKLVVDEGGSEEYIDGDKYHNVYGAKWIIGTDMVYNHGLERNIVRKGKDGHKTVELPIKVYMTHEPSMVERAIGTIDDIQIAVLKKRQAIAKMIPGPRVAIDMAKLHNVVSIGKKKYNILEALDLFPKTGVFVYSSKKHSAYDDADMLQSQGPPLEFLSSGVIEDLNTFALEISQQIDLLHKITGINKLTDGSLDNDRLLKDTVAGMNQSSSNAIEGEFSAYTYVYRSMLQYFMEKWRIGVVAGDIALSGMYGYSKKVTISIFKAVFNIKIILLPGEEDKMMLTQKIEQAFGSGQISIGIYFEVLRLIKEGDIAKAQLLLVKGSEEFAKKQQERDIEKITSQPKAQAEMQAQVLESEIKLEQVKTENAIKLENAKGEWKLRLEREKQGAETQRNTDSNITTSMIEGMKENGKSQEINGNVNNNE